MTVCSNHGYSNFNSYSYIEDPWSTVTSEINAQRPFVLSMYHGGTATDTTTAYGDHSVACVGYMEGINIGEQVVDDSGHLGHQQVSSNTIW